MTVIVTKPQFNVRDELNSLKGQHKNAWGPALSVQSNNSPSVSSNTWTKIPFNSVQYDTSKMWSSSGFYCVPQTPGFYLCTLNATPTSACPVVIAIRKNASEEWGTIGWNAINTAGQSTSTIIYCNGITDYLSGWVYFKDLTTTISQHSWQTTMNIVMLRGV